MYRGILKKLIGGVLVLFRDSEDWYVQAGKRRWRLGDASLRVTYREFGPVGVLTIESETFKNRYLEWVFGAKLQKVTDATYDDLDESSDFFCARLVSLHEGTKGLNPTA